MGRSAHGDRVAGVNARFGHHGRGQTRRRHVLVEDGGILNAYVPNEAGGTLTEREFKQAINAGSRQEGFPEPFPEAA